MHPRWCQGGGSSGKVGENKNERSMKRNSNRKANKVSVCNLILIGFPQHTQKSCADFNVGRSVTHWCPLALLVASRNASLSGSPQGALLPARLCSSELRAQCPSLDPGVSGYGTAQPRGGWQPAVPVLGYGELQCGCRCNLGHSTV